MTAVLPTSATANLSAHDVVATEHTLLPSADLPHAIGINLHLRERTPIHVRLHPDEWRAVVRIGVDRAELTLYVDLDQVERLAALFAHVRDRLR